MHRWSHPMNGIRVMGLSPGIHPTGRALLGTCATLRHSQSFMVFFFLFSYRETDTRRMDSFNKPASTQIIKE